MLGDASTRLFYPAGQKPIDATLSEILLDNFVNFFDWGFLDAGLYYNIHMPQSGIYGGDRNVLRPVQSPNYNNGQVWEGYRQNWVWESGINATTDLPINISGVFVDDTFYDIDNVSKPYYINYPDGRVVFDTAIPDTSEVKLEYSHKSVQVVPAKGIPWFRQLQQMSFRSEKDFQVSGSGGWVQLGQTRVQLPAIAVEVVPTTKMIPYQLGGGQWVHSDIVFYIMSENDWECNNISDTIVNQNNRTLSLFNPTSAGMSGVAPFNYRNELTENAVPSGVYPSLVANHFYRRCWIDSARGSAVTQVSPDLYMTTARYVTEVQPI